MIDRTNDGEVMLFKAKEVMQHNAITSGRFDFSACQLDVLFMILGFLKNGQRTYTIHANDISAITGREWNYQQLREATETMGSRMFEIETDKTFTQLWLFSKFEYKLGTGSFDVTINKEALPYFFDLKNTFTVIHLKSVLSCSSKYAKRLYALCCQWRSIQSKRLSIKELKQMLGLIDKKGNEQFVLWGDFRRYVLDVAKEQINANTNITFDYKPIKKGRSFQYIDLLIDVNNRLQLEIDFNEDISKQKFYQRLLDSGFNELQAKQISEGTTEEEYLILLDQLNKKKDLKVRTNGVAYLVGIYKKKGIIK
ncbi:MAG TPA: replication initiation protein [Edaphocola sp.]|nr:replication initiation protein [Edaphocola sp.]